MNTHQFFNLLDNKVRVDKISAGGIYNFTPEFIEEFNAQVKLLIKLAYDVNKALDKMTELEKQHFRYITSQHSR